MNSHYFINDDFFKDDIKYIDYEFKGQKFKFATHNGIFSKDHVDYATDILLSTIPSLSENSSLLDMGCGYGCIGIVLAKTYLLRLTATDVNFAAVELTQRNCQLANLNCQLYVSDCFEGIDDKFDTIVINPPIHAGKSVTYKMYEESLKYLNSGGKLYIVTFKKHGAESTLTKLRDVFDERIEVIYKRKGIYVIEAVS